MAARSNLKPVMKPVALTTEEADDQTCNGGKTDSFNNSGVSYTNDGRPKVPPKPKLRNSAAGTVQKPPTTPAETSFDDETSSPPSSSEVDDGTEV